MSSRQSSRSEESVLGKLFPLSAGFSSVTVLYSQPPPPRSWECRVMTGISLESKHRLPELGCHDTLMLCNTVPVSRRSFRRIFPGARYVFYHIAGAVPQSRNGFWSFWSLVSHGLVFRKCTGVLRRTVVVLLRERQKCLKILTRLMFVIHPRIASRFSSFLHARNCAMKGDELRPRSLKPLCAHLVCTNVGFERI